VAGAQGPALPVGAGPERPNFNDPTTPYYMDGLPSLDMAQSIKGTDAQEGGPRRLMMYNDAQLRAFELQQRQGLRPQGDEQPVLQPV